MKRSWIVLVLFPAVAILLVYLLIPGTIKISKIVYTNVKSASVSRALHDDAKWQQWFPAKEKGSNFIYDDIGYKPGKKKYASLDVSLTIADVHYTSSINVIEVNFDSSVLQWNLEFKASNNPLKKIEQYQTAKKIKSDITDALNSFATFIQQTKNIYGSDIQRTTLTDTALVSIRTITKQYPSTQLVYTLIEQLKQYIRQQHTSEHNFPMLNVTKLQDSSYEVMVGIPTNIPLPGNNIIKPKRMVMLKNKTLVTSITGDNNAIQQGFEAIYSYMNDYQLSSPVIPFQQLVTDRSKEKDSTKWVTKIFTPFS